MCARARVLCGRPAGAPLPQEAVGDKPLPGNLDVSYEDPMYEDPPYEYVDDDDDDDDDDPLYATADLPSATRLTVKHDEDRRGSITGFDAPAISAGDAEHLYASAEDALAPFGSSRGREGAKSPENEYEYGTAEQ